MSAPKRSYVTTGGSTATPHESTNKGLFDFGMVLIGQDDAFGWCPICFNKMDMNGANNEHILTNTEYKAIFASNMSDTDYNADWNVMQAHARCNSSKGTRGIFATWLAGRPTGLSDNQYQMLCGILDYLKNNKNKTSIGHFAKGEYKHKLQYIVAVVTGRSNDSVEQFIKKI
jgi:hypothetical protein